MARSKISILGGNGGVGSALTRNLILSSTAYEIALIGRRPHAVACQLMDLEALAPYGHDSIVRSGSIDDFADSDFIVVSASVPFSPERKRGDFLHDNVEVLRPYFREMARLPEDWSGYVIVVTKPVDVFCTWLQNHMQMDRRRVLGYSWNDSLRLIVDVAQALGASPSEVEAWVIGEHGDISIPLFDRISVAGRKVDLAPEQRREVLARMRDWYERWVKLGMARTTVWSTAEGVFRMIDLLGRESATRWASSVSLEGAYGIHNVSLGMPISMGGGMPGVREVPLNDHELDILLRASTMVRQQAQAIGAP